MSPNVERSVVPWSVFTISSALTYVWFFWECATPPQRLGTGNVTAGDRFLDSMQAVAR